MLVFAFILAGKGRIPREDREARGHDLLGPLFPRRRRALNSITVSAEQGRRISLLFIYGFYVYAAGNNLLYQKNLEISDCHAEQAN